MYLNAEIQPSAVVFFRPIAHLLLAVSSALWMVLWPAQPSSAAPATTSDLFISEYVEGSSNNKALEIYNGTGVAIDLSSGGYVIQFYSNGSSTASATILLTGTVADSDVFVFAHSSASSTILAVSDQTYGNFYNGDDAVVLKKGDTILDVIGQIGFRPDPEWGSDLVSTADNTLRRKSSICAGDPNGSDAFDPSVQWDGYAQDTFNGLGSHTADCATTAVALESASVSHSNEGVVIEWQTVSDLDHLGFHIQRREDRNPAWTQLTDTPIPSPSPGAPEGQHYHWTDSAIADNAFYHYRIDGVDLQGNVHPLHELTVVVGKPFQQWLPAILVANP